MRTRVPLIPKYFLRHSPGLNLLRALRARQPPAEIPICSATAMERDKRQKTNPEYRKREGEETREEKIRKESGK